MSEESSEIGESILTVLSALLTFAGPTYVVYVLLGVLNINRFVATGSGLILFIAGLMLVWYRSKREVVS